MLTAFVQGALMIVTGCAVFLAAFVFTKNGSLGDLVREMGREHPSKMSMPGDPQPVVTYRYLFSQLLLFTVFTMGQPHLLTKFFTLNSDRKLLRSAVIGGAGMWVVATALLAVGALGPALLVIEPAAADSFIPSFINDTFPALVASLFMAGLVSAGMSTISSLVVAVSGAFARDLYQQLLRPSASDASVVALSRAATVVAGAVGLVIALTKATSIFDLIVMTFSAFGVIAVPILLGVRWMRATREGAIAGLVVGEIYVVLATFVVEDLAFGFVAGVPAAGLTAIVMIVASLMSAPPPPRVMVAHFTR